MKPTRHRPCADAYPSATSDLLPHLPDPARRRLLKLMGATGAMGAASQLLAPLTAIAQTTGGSDYKAIVCLFMYGGNDANNMVVPRDPTEYALYRTGRTNLALPQDSLLPLTTTPAPAGTTDTTSRYGLHPAMSGLANLYTQGRLSVVANVGPLLAPTTKAQWNDRSVPLPQGLFSHSDQQDAWQSALYDTMGRTGWGGRLMERLVAEGSVNRGYACISLAGGNLWQTGDVSLLAYKMSSSGNFGFDFYRADSTTDPLTLAIQQTLADQRPHVFHQAWLNTMGRSIEMQQVLSNALKSSTVGTAFPNSGLGRQLNTVAKLVSARASLGLSRQVFFVSIDGFDTHGDEQLGQQNRLFNEISQAVTAFHQSTVDMGVADRVTLFTASDFGRTFASNGQGSDHGWGSHQFVVGGAVKGGRLLGSVPNQTLNGPDDTGAGRWIPTLSSDQLSASLARWFGADAGVIRTVLPHSAAFDALDLMA